MRTFLRTGVVTVTLIASAFALGACKSSTSKCSGGSCEIHLSGAGAGSKVDGRSLGSGTKTVFYSLKSATDGSATITVEGTDGTCKTGETVAIGSFSATCTDVKADEVTFTLKAA